jgi:AcrR family transcriptional regulator
VGQRQDLLEGAKRCIAEKGYSRTTARDIVAVSGANLAAIGYHFGSKEALLNAAVLDSFDEWGDAVEAAMHVSEEGRPLDRLEAFLAGLLSESGHRRTVLVASVQAFAEAEFAPDVRRQLGETYEQGRIAIASMILGIDPAEVDESSRQLGSLALAIVNGMVLQWLIDPDAAPSAAGLAEAIRMLVGASPG